MNPFKRLPIFLANRKCPCGREVARSPLLPIGEKKIQQRRAALAKKCVGCYQIDCYVQSCVVQNR